MPLSHILVEKDRSHLHNPASGSLKTVHEVNTTTTTTTTTTAAAATYAATTTTIIIIITTTITIITYLGRTETVEMSRKKVRISWNGCPSSFTNGW